MTVILMKKIPSIEEFELLIKLFGKTGTIPVQEVPGIVHRSRHKKFYHNNSSGELIRLRTEI